MRKEGEEEGERRFTEGGVEGRGQWPHHQLALLWAQVDHARSLHYVGAGVAFPAGLLFVCLHCALSYQGATAPLDLAVAYLRSVLAVIAFITLVLSILSGWGSRELIL